MVLWMLPLLVFFPSIQYGLLIILCITEMKFKTLAKHYSGPAKVTDFICYSQTVNLAFIEHNSILVNYEYIYIYIYTFIYTYIIYSSMRIYIDTFPPLFMYSLLLLCSCIYWKQFSLFTSLFFHRNFWCYLDNYLLKKIHSLKTSAESFFVILGLILEVFLYLLTAVKPFLIKVCKDVFILLQCLLH